LYFQGEVYKSWQTWQPTSPIVDPSHPNSLEMGTRRRANRIRRHGRPPPASKVGVIDFRFSYLCQHR